MRGQLAGGLVAAPLQALQRAGALLERLGPGPERGLGLAHLRLQLALAQRALLDGLGDLGQRGPGGLQQGALLAQPALGLLAPGLQLGDGLGALGDPDGLALAAPAGPAPAVEAAVGQGDALEALQKPGDGGIGFGAPDLPQQHQQRGRGAHHLGQAAGGDVRLRPAGGHHGRAPRRSTSDRRASQDSSATACASISQPRTPSTAPRQSSSTCRSMRSRPCSRLQRAALPGVSAAPSRRRSCSSWSPSTPMPASHSASVRTEASTAAEAASCSPRSPGERPARSSSRAVSSPSSSRAALSRPLAPGDVLGGRQVGAHRLDARIQVGQRRLERAAVLLAELGRRWPAPAPAPTARRGAPRRRRPRTAAAPGSARPSISASAARLVSRAAPHSACSVSRTRRSPAASLRARSSSATRAPLWVQRLWTPSRRSWATSRAGPEADLLLLGGVEALLRRVKGALELLVLGAQGRAARRGRPRSTGRPGAPPARDRRRRG